VWHGIALALAAAFFGAFLAPDGLRAQDYTELPPELEARAQHLYVNIMCPICDGQTIQQSHAPIAADMRSIIRERLLANETDQEIVNLMVESYGEGVLASPPKRGFALTVWIIPPLVLLLGAGVVFLVIRGLLRGARASARPELTQMPSERELEPYLSMVDEEISGGTEPARGSGGG
jgi:cytochrome c-type biogenesis protein CcmH